MTGYGGLRAAVTGLIAMAATAEQVLLAEAGPAEDGSPERWAALPLIAHNTEFRRQQVQRLRAVRCGHAPPEFAEADHRSAALYAELSAQPADAVARDSWRVAGELADEVRVADLQDLTEPARNPWLRGRQLWLQIIVRGFWHPTGHLGEYYLSHGQPDRGVALAEHAIATASYLRSAGSWPWHGELQPGLRSGGRGPARGVGGGSNGGNRAQSRPARERHSR